MELSSGRTESISDRQTYLVKPEHDPATLRRLLEARRTFAAYALGQLEPELFPLTHWWTAKGGGGHGLVLFSRGGLGDALFAMGDAHAVQAILRLHPGPRTLYATCQPEHLPALRKHCFLTSETIMSRMAVKRETFQFVPPAEGFNVRRLTNSDLRPVNRLYSAEGGASFYNSTHLREGVYYGLLLGDEVVAVAGTHVAAPHEGIAVVGNVFTHPRHRGKGHATAVTAAVTEALLHDCRDVVLTVDPANIPAVQAYRKLGYQHSCEIVEAAAVRKEPTGVSSLIRRRFATWRGRRYGGETITVS
ncbi:MAG: GNAT family N-acetyltransferase [Dehalococcoidia bacterium]|nr:GNAT family N-acetyltransferase [Dehalococcoidia bacterium]